MARIGYTISISPIITNSSQDFDFSIFLLWIIDSYLSCPFFHLPWSGTAEDCQTVYEEKIWCLCTVTFEQKCPKLNSRQVYCLQLTVCWNSQYFFFPLTQALRILPNVKRRNTMGLCLANIQTKSTLTVEQQPLLLPSS